jgi:hypothetical protein
MTEQARIRALAAKIAAAASMVMAAGAGRFGSARQARAWDKLDMGGMDVCGIINVMDRAQLTSVEHLVYGAGRRFSRDGLTPPAPRHATNS